MKNTDNIKKLLYIFIILFSISCKEESKDLVTEKYTKQLLNTIPGTEIYTNRDILFVKTAKEMGSTNISHLFRLYNHEYKNKYKNFESFIFQALNQKIAFKNELFNERNVIVFTIDKKIESTYLASGITNLLKEYFKKNKKKWTLINQTLSNNEIYTLLYYSYLNGYHTSFDDAIGVYEVWPLK